MSPVCNILCLSLVLSGGCFAVFTNVGSGCRDQSGRTYHDNDVWYESGECARYGCYNKQSPSTYKISCPEYPIPDCHYQLVSAPGSPFPYCCIRPACV